MLKTSIKLFIIIIIFPIASIAFLMIFTILLCLEKEITYEYN